MKNSERLIIELRALNTKLSEVTNNKNRFMIYSSKPGKFMLFNFLAGLCHTLGAVFGTAIAISVSIYIFSRFNFTKPISNWIETTMQQVNWQKIVPKITPTNIEIDQSTLDKYINNQ